MVRGKSLFLTVVAIFLFIFTAQAEKPADKPVVKPNPEASAGAPKPEVLTNADVTELVVAKLGSDLVIAQIKRAEAVAFDLSTDGLVSLKKQAVPDEVVKAMMARQDAKGPITVEPPASAVAPPSAQAGAAPEGPPSRWSRIKGRAKSAVTRESDEPEAKPTEAAGGSSGTEGDVRLYLTARPTEPFKEIGRVSSGKFNFAGMSRERSAIDTELKKKAAKLGANAVIDITEDFANVSGVAVLVLVEQKP